MEMLHQSRAKNSAIRIRFFYFVLFFSSRRKLGDVLQRVYGQAAARRLPGGSAVRCINCLYISIHPPGWWPFPYTSCSWVTLPILSRRRPPACRLALSSLRVPSFHPPLVPRPIRASLFRIYVRPATQSTLRKLSDPISYVTLFPILSLKSSLFFIGLWYEIYLNKYL